MSEDHKKELLSYKQRINRSKIDEILWIKEKNFILEIEFIEKGFLEKNKISNEDNERYKNNLDFFLFVYQVFIKYIDKPISFEPIIFCEYPQFLLDYIFYHKHNITNKSSIFSQINKLLETFEYMTYTIINQIEEYEFDLTCPLNNNIIFGLYNGFDSLKTNKGGIYYFMKSLRKYNKSCKVVIICEKKNIFDELISFSKETDFEIYTNFEPLYEIMYYRFEIYKQYLDNNNQVYDRILFSDINDVLFQEDPFLINFNEEIYCALEINNFSDNKNSSSRMNVEFINQCAHLRIFNPNNFINRYIVCAGTILGSHVGIMKYLNFYKEVQSYKIINDQGLFNTYIYNLCQSKSILFIENSKIITFDKVDLRSLNIDVENKCILNNNLEKYSIVHQINRYNIELVDYLLNLEPEPSISAHF
jgi:hypothetical protein